MSDLVDIVETDAPQEAQAVEEAQQPEGLEPSPKERLSGKLAEIIREKRIERQQARRAQEEAARKSAEAEAIQSKYAKVRENPIAHLKEAIGHDYTDLTKLILETEETSPQESVAQLKREFQKLQEKLQQQEAEKQARLDAEQMDAGQKFYEKHVFDNADQYEYLSLEDPEWVRAAVWQVASAYFDRVNDAPDPADVAKVLEEQLAKKYSVIEQRRQQRIAARTQSQATADEATGSTKATGAKQGMRTLTEKRAAERSSLPADFRSLSQAEQRNVMVEYLKLNPVVRD